MVENGNASIVHDCWLALQEHYPHVSLDAFVKMPNHVHGIIVLRHADGTDPGFAADLARIQYHPVLQPARYTPKRSNVFRTEPRYPPPK